MATDLTIPPSQIFREKIISQGLEKDDRPRKLDNVSDLIGHWSPYHKRLCLWMIFMYINSPFNNVALVYYATKSDFWCESVAGQKIDPSLPNDCNFNQSNLCDTWVHNTSRVTLIKEWNLVCDRAYLLSFVLSAYQVGYLFSGLTIGYLSDRFGRKIGIIICISLEIVAGFGLTFSSSIYSFIFFRFIHGVGGFGRYLAALLILIETVGSDYRGKVVVAFDWVWHFGTVLMMLTTYFLESFRHLFLGVTLYQIVSLFLLVMKIPESIRWQLVKQRPDSAKKTLEKFFPVNLSESGQKLEQEIEKLSKRLAKKTENCGSNSLLTILSNLQLLKYCLSLYGLFIIVSFLGYGMDYYALDLSGNYFWNSALLKISNIAATAFLTWQVEKYQRKSIIIVCSIMLAISMFAMIPMIPKQNLIVLRDTDWVSAGFFLAIVFSMGYVYASELFPTTVRHIAVGSCSTAGRIGSILAPFLTEFIRVTSISFVSIVMGVSAIIGSLLVLLLPETKGREMPNTVEEMLKISSENKKSSIV